MLADLDRPIEQVHYEPWRRDVAVRSMSAAQFVEVMRKLSATGEDETAAKIDVWSVVCSYGVVDPVYTAEEWAAGARLKTLIHFGNMILSRSSQDMSGAAKKN